MPLSGTERLTLDGDIAMHMLDGIHTYIDGLLVQRVEERTAHWKALFAGEEVEKALNDKRGQLRTVLGAVDKRVPVKMETLATPGEEGPVATGKNYKIYAVRWAVLPGVFGEGHLLEPDTFCGASLVVLPDADETPESLLGLAEKTQTTYPLRFAEAGYRVLVMDLVNRESTWSGHPEVRMTKQPHREFIYRGAYEMGRHIIGYEILKVEAAIDWLKQKSLNTKLGLIGHAEGGMLAQYTAALETRVDATMVSGHFGPRELLWEEPIYRNVWSLLNTFGDAEIAAMIAPRQLIIDSQVPPKIDTPPYSNEKYYGTAPGQLQQVSKESVQVLVQQAKAYADLGINEDWIHFMDGPTRWPDLFNEALGGAELGNSTSAQPTTHPMPDPSARMQRQVHELLDWTKHIMEEAPFVRETLWKDADMTSVETWETSTAKLREYFHKDIIGALPESTVPMNPRTREVYNTDAYTGYEVVLDVHPEVIAYGILLVPHDIQPGEQRPVVVCQHGLEGRPQDVASPEINNPYYEQYGCKLAEEGFIVYAPQNLYIHYDHFRTIQRKANPLGLSLFSFIVDQHQTTLDWLKTLPFVDEERMAFYGLSYGGETAMRVPAIVEDYCLSICSGDFNEWIWKNVTRRRIYSYVFHGEYEMFEWNLGNTFNYAEMSWLICPRPFMVERGHGDGVAPDEWVGYEYARTRNRYDLLGLEDETRIEYFNGPHKIHGVGTFQFLHDKLNFNNKVIPAKAGIQ